MFSARQNKILRFPYCKDYKMITADGAIRSGKSAPMVISYIIWVMATFNNQITPICGKSVATVKRNVIKGIVMSTKYLRDNFKLEWKGGEEHVLTVSRGKVTNYFYVFGGPNEKSYQTVQGGTWAACLFDEVALLPKSFVEQCTARCSVPGSKYWFNCNPEDPNHWFNVDYIQRAKELKMLYLHFTQDDNPSLSEDIKEFYRSQYKGVFYQRYILGLWVRAEGIIYKPFADDNNKYLTDDDYSQNDDLWLVNVGVDFGNNKSSHTFCATGITRNFEKVVFLKTKKISKSITPTELDREFTDFVEEIHSKYNKVFKARCDSAETTLINGFKVATSNKHQWYCEVWNAIKGVINDRINLFCRLFSEERIEIYRKGCPDLIKAFNTAVWDDKHPNQRLDVVGHDNPVDMLDAAEYSVEEYADNLLKFDLFNLKNRRKQ